MWQLYTKYSQKVFSKWKPFEKESYKYYPVPGCKPHREILNNDARGKLLFDRYVNRPQLSHNLYWRTHPVEYKRMIDQLALK